VFTDFVVHCNRIGFEDGLNFWGGSTVADPDGEVLAHGPYFEEALIVHEIDLNQLHRSRARLPLLRDERTGLMARELARILSANPQGFR
jgi:NAD+ synthase (glutamine-hydrolysing)